MRKPWKIIKIAVNALMLLFLVFSIVIFLLGISVSKNKGLILPLGAVGVQSGSMSPRFEAGDAILIKKVKTQSLKEGDVITFYYGSALVTHSIIEIDGQVIITKGVAEGITMTETISARQIVGKYTGVRLKGFFGFVDFARSVWGFLLLITLPIVIFFIVEAVDLYKNVRERKKAEKL